MKWLMLIPGMLSVAVAAFSIGPVGSVYLLGDHPERGDVPSVAINAVDLAANGDGWAVGDRGYMWERKDAKWIEHDPVIESDLHDVAFNTRYGVWIVGDGGAIMSLRPGIEPSKWRVVHVTPLIDLQAVDVGEDGAVMAVGNMRERSNPGIIIRYDEESDEWLEVSQAPEEIATNFYDISVLDLLNYYVVGSYGEHFGRPTGWTILRHRCDEDPNGEFQCLAHRTNASSSEEGPLLAVDVDKNSASLWAVGEGGLVVYEGRENRYIGRMGGVELSLLDVAIHGPNEAVVVGEAGFIGRASDPGTWSCSARLHGRSMTGVGRSGADDGAWVVGEASLLQYLQRPCSPNRILLPRLEIAY